MYFATIDQLRTVNDREEFNYSWESTSYFFSNEFSPIIESYDRLFSQARILCLGTQLSRKCWARFCENNRGICYQFSFVENRNTDVSSREVEYAHRKEFNLPQYILQRIEELYPMFFQLLAKETELSREERIALLQWLEEGIAQKISHSHIVDELTFKKTQSFVDENEYRFIHPEGDVEPPRKVRMDESQKLTLEQIGLKLERIFTSDPSIVESECQSAGLKIKVSKPSFLD